MLAIPETIRTEGIYIVYKCDQFVYITNVCCAYIVEIVKKQTCKQIYFEI